MSAERSEGATGARGQSPRRLFYQVIAFLGSFLLFQIEVLITKLLLPSFGGAAYVWTSCMMFFQGALLAGYGYSRWALSRWEPSRYARAHLLLLLFPLVFFPLPMDFSSAGARPLLQLLGLLSRSIAAPFFVLSTTTPVIQSWMRQVPGEEAEKSYSVFAASNAGALFALLSYPFLVEPFFDLKSQLILWQCAYALFAVLHWLCRPRALAPGERLVERLLRPAPALGGSDAKSRLLWFLLSLGPSASLLSATNLLMLDFSAVPLLWIVPLALYLSTFILNFKRRPWYPERLSLVIAVSIAVWLLLVLLTVLCSPDLAGQWQAARRLWVVNKLIFLAAALFIVCMICHRALALEKPAAEDSPRFYFWTACGGWGGGLLIGVLIPWLFRRTAMPELDWALAGGISVGALVLRDLGRRAPPGAKVDSAGLRLSQGGPLGLRIGIGALTALIVLAAAGFGFYVNRSLAFSGGSLFSLRNFYGYYKVVEQEGLRKFYHGNTLHGVQYVEPSKRGVTLLYYHRRAPLAQVFETFGPSFRSVGVVGLGAGVIAAFGRPGQSIDFYELDPDVAKIAREYFTFLNDSRAETRIVTGDARISLERDASARYDLLVLDAFTGGAIPVHLLTEEACRLYLRRLSEGGIIVFHVTNRFLNLRPVLSAMARDLGIAGAARAVDPTEYIKDEMHYSSWVVLSRDRSKIRRLIGLGWKDLGPYSKGAKPWTDRYASLWSALRP